MKRIKKEGSMYLLMLLAALGLGIACETEDQEIENAAQKVSQVKTGVFLDSAVEGIRYQTDSQEGVTDVEGTFRYLSGETITFSVGTVPLGSGLAEAAMTPVSLVEGATEVSHETVLNIARFLQTLDHDGDPSNGIKIEERVTALMKDSGLSIGFNQSTEDFEKDAHVQQLIGMVTTLTSETGGNAGLVSSAQAQEHLESSLGVAEAIVLTALENDSEVTPQSTSDVTTQSTAE